VFGKARYRPTDVVVSARTRRRVRKMSTEDLQMHMESLVSRTMPEAYSLWAMGAIPHSEIDLCVESVLAVWNELSSRTKLHL